MARTTTIEWTEHTWNPFVGCSVHSAGCTNCYAMRQAFRIEQFGSAPHYAGVTEKRGGAVVWTGKIARASDRAFHKPAEIRGRALIFVNSMSDFWHSSALDEWRIKAIEVMRAIPRHAFQVLTKRPEEALAFFARNPGVTLPDNFWAGVTVERADVRHRIDTLRQIDAKVRFISFEPLIGDAGPVDLRGIDWAITGGESGIGHRRCDAAWVRSLHRQAQAQGVAHFFKQWGHWTNNPLRANCPPGVSGEAWIRQVDPVGKGGSLLDGEPCKQMPSCWQALQDEADVTHSSARLPSGFGAADNGAAHAPGQCEQSAIDDFILTA